MIFAVDLIGYFCIVDTVSGSNVVNVVSGVPKGSVLGRVLFLLCTSELYSILKNKLYMVTLMPPL